MKSTTLLINGKKTSFDYKKLLKAWNENAFEIKAEMTRYVDTSFGKAKLEHLHNEKMFKLSYLNYNDIKYIND